ncbi:alpha/beta fold hydrolase [Thiohalophilus thiocyanatoxydans]|uniref:Pimeloyl-ACP methyl ester carboxylesterase n=1 Tax=Thiohalophilus thiocyanatoxydans TaxID=381308 RepID=A0A4R8IM64_9GAMM|nr:alpha/beta hydrolase [Thiohalophilus thiocyanatoxydans]TDX96751.1 pimeloyl-ACP methyl ester carboxylesterase [Thiohalophilus thiocyanatoxydans]
MPSEELRFITAPDGVRLGYKLVRQGPQAPTLVMLHGLASNHSRWSEFVGNTELRRDWNLLRPDLRGHSYSMTRKTYHREHWVDDLAAVLQQEKLHNVVILGHSLGAQIAMDFALRYSTLCGGLILLDPVFPELLHGKLGKARRWRPLLWLIVRLLRLGYALGLGQREFPIRDLHALDVKTRELLKQTSASEIARLYTNPRVDLEFIPLANYLQDVLEVVRPLPDYTRITRPVRVLLSTGTSLSDHSTLEAKIARIPHSDIVPVHCNHWPMTEKPEEVREIIETTCRQWQAQL